MRALDTNILARFYVDDPGDPEAVNQRPIAQRIIVEGSPLFVPLTVILELEWVLSAFYGFKREAFARVTRHLLGLSHVRVEEWPRVVEALDLHERGLDFADALHLLASAECDEMYSFDDKKFGRRAKRLGCTPSVIVPINP